MNETDLLRQVYDLARLFGWLFFHPLPARRESGTDGREIWRTAMMGDKGFPDCVLVRAPRVIFLELKTDSGRLSAEQHVWRAALEACAGIEYRTIRPADIPALAAALAYGAVSL